MEISLKAKWKLEWECQVWTVQAHKSITQMHFHYPNLFALFICKKFYWCFKTHGTAPWIDFNFLLREIFEKIIVN
jgi:hypothetical protein